MKSSSANADAVYVTELERFGYTIKAVGRTAKEAEDAVIEEYIRTFEDLNDGLDPAEAYEWDDARSYLDIARDELYTEKIELGKAWWS